MSRPLQLRLSTNPEHDAQATTMCSLPRTGPSNRRPADGFVRCVSPQGTLQRLSKKLGVDLRVAHFVRLQCGEGLDNQKADFAAEVAAMTS